MVQWHMSGHVGMETTAVSTASAGVSSTMLYLPWSGRGLLHSKTISRDSNMDKEHRGPGHGRGGLKGTPLIPGETKNHKKVT